MANLLGFIKATMEFAKDRTTWSESHWYSQQVAITDAALYAAVKALAAQRVECLGGDVRLLMAKMSKEGVNRDVNYLKTGDMPLVNSGGGYAGGPAYPPAGTVWAYQSPQVSWPIKLLDNNNNQISIVYIAGMPASTTQTGPGVLQNSAGGGFGPFPYLSQYATYLTSGPWGAASRTWPSGNFTAGNSTAQSVNPTYQAAAGSTPAQLLLKLPALIKTVTDSTGGTTDLAPQVGEWIRVGGWKYTSPQNRIRLNGTYQLVSLDGQGFWHVNVPRLRTDPLITTPGYVQAAGYFFQQYRSFVLDDLTHRKRGVTTAGARGRRSSQ